MYPVSFPDQSDLRMRLVSAEAQKYKWLLSRLSGAW